MHQNRISNHIFPDYIPMSHQTLTEVTSLDRHDFCVKFVKHKTVRMNI